MVGTLLRSRRSEHHAQVTSVELFFDLVFVIAVTQISHALVEHLTWLGALEAALLLLAIWWAWIDTAWITNWLDPEKPLVRLMLFVLMGIGLVMSSSCLLYTSDAAASGSCGADRRHRRQHRGSLRLGPAGALSDDRHIAPHPDLWRDHPADPVGAQENLAGLDRPVQAAR